MKYCILGGGGSFGLHTAAYILERGLNVDQIISIGRSPHKSNCFSMGIGDDDPRYSYHQFHITYEFDLLMEFLDKEQPNIFINFAAQGESAASLHNCWRYYETNCVGLSRLVEALQKRDYLKKFIHIGTSELYGSTEVPATENHPLNPTSPYAVSKAAFDLHLMSVAKYGFPMNIIRPSNSYGEGQQLHRIIPKAILYGLTGRKLPLHGGGKAEKSYIHSWDLARAIYVVARHGVVGHMYNVGPTAPTAIRDVVNHVAMALGMSFNDLCEITEDREHQDSRYWIDSTKINKELYWNPVIDWKEGLRRTIEWEKKYLNELKNLSTDFVMRG